MTFRLTSLFLLCCLLIAPFVFGKSISAGHPQQANVVPQSEKIKIFDPSVKAPAQPDVVLFGVYPILISDLDLYKSTFNISFYAWWRTTNKDYHPNETLEIVNANSYYFKHPDSGQNGNEYYTYVHYYAKIHQDWVMDYFPFDRQFLEVALEDDSGSDWIIFEPDFEQSHIDPNLSIKGWKILSLTLRNSITHYDTNFGDILSPKGMYSRLTFTIEIKREGWRPYFNYFIGFFIAAFLAIMMHFIKPEKLEVRSALLIGAIFSWVGNKYIVDQVMPITTDFTLVDYIQIATLFAIVFSVSSFIVIDSFVSEPRRKSISDLSGILSFLVYAGFIAICTYQAIIS